MCNLQDHYQAWDAYAEFMRDIAPLRGPPVDLPQGPVRPSEPTPIVTADGEGSRLELLPWGWKPASGKGLVINLRSEGRREGPTSRGLTFPTAFYEYAGDKPPKAQWRFVSATNEPIAFAVIRRGGAYALLTCEPGPDVAPIHGRQPVILPRSAWGRWLAEPAWPADLTGPSPAGALRATRTR
jgi:putative SOS response-associated peptidase YedK